MQGHLPYSEGFRAFHWLAVSMQAVLVEPATGADAPVWRGPLSGEKSEAAITMSAYAFDTLVSPFLPCSQAEVIMTSPATLQSGCVAALQACLRAAPNAQSEACLDLPIEPQWSCFPVACHSTLWYGCEEVPVQSRLD